ncbi:hypothetical protein [Carboxylicivirga sp. N1Y90]|uniref:hypothetical protein n=1 Tax=Carboxylicivirga fragile TaxID=3417571 RepID=UPI003D34D4DE|nr:hypothetical protein [Marinilabiliaceae bacterium N1Y90]
MEVYIDKNFINNYWAIDSSDAVITSFCDDFLKHANRYTLITNYASEEEMYESEEAELFIDDIVQQQNAADMVYLQNLLDEDCLSSCLNNGGCKLLFIECDEQNAIDLERKYGYRVITSATLKTKWSEYIKYNDVEKTIVLPADESDDEIFNNWSDLKFISTFPTNSIVIADKYILSDKSQGRLKDNLIPMLEQLIPVDYQGELSIAILSESILSQENCSPKERAIKTHSVLNRHFAKYKHLKIKFTILKFDKYFNSGKQPKIHDRHIYTNYYTIKCGIGFDLFNKNERKVEDSEVSIRFNFQPRQMKTLPVKLNGLKVYVNNMKKMDKMDVFKMYPENFDKFHCHLLN